MVKQSRDLRRCLQLQIHLDGTASLKLIVQRIDSVSVFSANAPPGNTVRYVKTPELMEIVRQQRPARVFLGFARFPVLQLEDPDCTTQTLVHLADLRYTEPRRSRGTFALSIPIDCPTQ